MYLYLYKKSRLTEYIHIQKKIDYFSWNIFFFEKSNFSTIYEYTSENKSK